MKQPIMDIINVKSEENNEEISFSDADCFDCPLCSESFVNCDDLSKHTRKHLKGEHDVETINCNFCSEQFYSSTDFAKHSSVHCEENALRCKTCGKLYKKKKALATHLKKHCKPIMCKICNKSFTVKNSLRNHLLSHVGEKNLSCKHCSKTFGNKDNLYRHMRRHSSEKTFVCTICDKAYYFGKELKRHMLSHTNKREFKCEICKKGFNVKYKLNRHFMHAHFTIIKCVFCKKEFPTRELLMDHVHTYAKNKNYTCKKCDKKFESKCAYDQHLQNCCHKFIPNLENNKESLLSPIYSVKDLFSCYICRKEFSDENNLNHHEYLHTRERKYKCDVCNKSFLTKQGLGIHCKTQKHRKKLSSNQMLSKSNNLGMLDDIVKKESPNVICEFNGIKQEID